MSYPLVLFVAILISVLTIHLLTKDRKTRNQFRQEWETGAFSRLREAPESIASYWENKKNNADSYDGVDLLTWHDLSMDQVFRKMNYTQTSVGSEYLLNQLRDIDISLNHIEKDEKLYITLGNNQELREEILLALSKLGKRDYTNSSSFFYGKAQKALKNANVFLLLALLPVASIVLVFFQLKWGLLFLFLSFLINAFMYYRHKNALEYGLHSVNYAANIIHTGKKLATLKDDSISEYTNRLQTNLKPLKKLLFLSNFVSVGNKGGGEFDVIFEYIRILFLIDFISYNKIIGTVTKHADNYREVWQVIGKLDAAVAVAFYRHSLTSYCKPEFTDSEEISFVNMAHPLLDKPVTNSSRLGKCTLITGSNASGKSTYSKAVAINAILAQTIHTALADHWSMKPSFVATSMAVQDNVLDGDSYFIAEIKSLKRIIKLLEEGKPCISVIDELLKGTNTAERIAASGAIMEWLSKGKGINITASHDIELTEMMKRSYENYHFTETFIDGDIHFDYKIRSGPSTSRNAIKLLEVLSYPEEITEQANRLAEDFMNEREWKVLMN
ncbi:MutS-related protein [Sporosarcina koreensis]|uniref:DNA mismatch repair proteins mutS family domain-containing protein n=1 Tax=Sporosarcina koreensis TaxID=334735 RepID=A0ABW0TTY0_9BACL